MEWENETGAATFSGKLRGSSTAAALGPAHWAFVAVRPTEQELNCICSDARGPKIAAGEDKADDAISSRFDSK